MVIFVFNDFRLEVIIRIGGIVYYHKHFFHKDSFYQEIPNPNIIQYEKGIVNIYLFIVNYLEDWLSTK